METAVNDRGYNCNDVTLQRFKGLTDIEAHSWLKC